MGDHFDSSGASCRGPIHASWGGIAWSFTEHACLVRDLLGFSDAVPSRRPVLPDDPGRPYVADEGGPADSNHGAGRLRPAPGHVLYQQHQNNEEKREERRSNEHERPGPKGGTVEHKAGRIRKVRSDDARTLGAKESAQKTPRRPHAPIMASTVDGGCGRWASIPQPIYQSRWTAHSCSCTEKMAGE